MKSEHAVLADRFDTLKGDRKRPNGQIFAIEIELGFGAARPCAAGAKRDHPIGRRRDETATRCRAGRGGCTTATVKHKTRKRCCD